MDELLGTQLKLSEMTRSELTKYLDEQVAHQSHKLETAVVGMQAKLEGMLRSEQMCAGAKLEGLLRNEHQAPRREQQQQHPLARESTVESGSISMDELLGVQLELSVRT